MNHTYHLKNRILHIAAALLLIVCIVIKAGIDVKAEESTGSTDTEIIVTATDDNTSQNDLKYALNSDEEAAFSTNNVFNVKKGEGYVVYVKDLAGNITSKIVNVSDTGQVTTETNTNTTTATDSKKSSSSKSSGSKGTTIINVSPYDNSNIKKEASNTTGNETVTTASGSGEGTVSTGTVSNGGLSDALKGEGTVIEESGEYVSGSDGGKEFYTIQTKDEHVFYLVVDHDQNADNVYFLDSVTEEDLISLAANNENESNNEKSSIFGKSESKEIEAEDQEAASANAKEAAPKKENNAMSKLLTILPIAAIGGGIYYFIKKKKNKQILDDADDIEDFEAIDDDMVYEDEESTKEKEQTSESDEEQTDEQ